MNTNILNKNSSTTQKKLQIKKLFEEESKLIYIFSEKIKKVFEKDKEIYPYPINKDIKFDIKNQEKNIFYSLRKFLTKNLEYELYDEVDFSNVTFDLFGCKILAELIKKCEGMYLLRLNECIFPEKGLEEILNSLNFFDDFFTLELNGVKLNFNNLKQIAWSNYNSNKKKIIYDNSNGNNDNKLKQCKILNKKGKKVKDFSFK